MNLISGMIGALVMMFGIYIAQRNGYQLWAVATEEHNLNLRKAAPLIDSIVRIKERQVLPTSHRPFHYIVASIHNYGNLPAQQLSGYWRMYSPDKTINECTVPIQRDALGSTPYEAEQQLIGVGIAKESSIGIARSRSMLILSLITSVFLKSTQNITQQAINTTNKSAIWYKSENDIWRTPVYWNCARQI